MSKSVIELRQSALKCSQDVVIEMTTGGGHTLNSLARLETNLRVALAAVNALKNQATGQPEPKIGE